MRRPRHEARELAASVLAALGRTRDAMIVRSGGGDDFPEVRVETIALKTTDERTQLLERALRYYADADPLKAEVVEGALAFLDRGEVARLALAGKDSLAQRDSYAGRSATSLLRRSAIADEIFVEAQSPTRKHLDIMSHCYAQTKSK